MSAFYESARRLLEAGLTCPKCGSANRSRATCIVVESPDRATCIVCSHTAALAAFTPAPR